MLACQCPMHSLKISLLLHTVLTHIQSQIKPQLLFGESFTLSRAKSIKAPTHHPDANQQPTAFIRPLCCLLSDPFGRKVALNTLLRHGASSTVARTFCAYRRCNKWVALVYKKDAGREVYAWNSLLLIKTKLNYFRQKQLHTKHAARHYQMNTD